MAFFSKSSSPSKSYMGSSWYLFRQIGFLFVAFSVSLPSSSLLSSFLACLQVGWSMIKDKLGLNFPKKEIMNWNRGWSLGVKQGWFLVPFLFIIFEIPLYSYKKIRLNRICIFSKIISNFINIEFDTRKTQQLDFSLQKSAKYSISFN